MKWYSVKKYRPSYIGYYIVRFIHERTTGLVDVTDVFWDGKNWIDFDDGEELDNPVTHFAIPDPVEIEE
jgi:hypothetical protein